MAPTPATARDRLQRLLDLAAKTMRLWWLVALFAVLGGGLSLAFALARGRIYQAEVVLEYQERIKSTLLMNREEAVNRNLGDRYRELLLAHDQLLPIVKDPALDPFPAGTDEQLAIDRLRQSVRFESRGGATFRISYGDADADRARRVADRLAKLLQDKDEAMRNESAQDTVAFATQQKDEAAGELHERERALAEFLVKHPEFVADPNQPTTEGAGIRAIHSAKSTDAGSPRLRVLERQRQRIQARLDAPPDAPPIRVVAPPSDEKRAAEAEVADAQRELAAANHALEDAREKYTDEHPAVKNAQQRVATAEQNLRRAEGRVPPDVETVVAPATAADRTKLQKELAQIESLIADEQHRTSKGNVPTTTDSFTNALVQLDTQHDELRRKVNEQRDRVAALATAVSRAETDANEESKQQGRLRVINAAEKPSHPSGPGKTIFLLAGMVLFVGLGTALAIGLAVIDDRLYRRYDIDQLGVAVLAVIPPHARDAASGKDTA